MGVVTDAGEKVRECDVPFGGPGSAIDSLCGSRNVRDPAIKDIQVSLTNTDGTADLWDRVQQLALQIVPTALGEVDCVCGGGKVDDGWRTGVQR